ncbi:MAG: AAA family ATPase [Candidatus Onthovivens sp.]|nr:AAA family ATPase [Candidatus Onthovivens sp.]
MGKKVLIIGESGTGKSASMRNFTKDEILIINVASKDLPFKEPKGGFEKVNTDNYRDVKRAMQNTYKKVIVIDDAQYLMANEFMRRATEKGFDKFTEIAQNYWDLQQSITKLPDDVIVYELSHLERDANGNEKAKTIGKMLDEKITLEGMFGIVLKTLIQDGKYYFQTQNSGTDTCKSPIGLFKTFLIDNDLKAVDTAIRNYYNLNTITTTEVKTEVKEEVKEEVVAEKSLAEKLADFKNQEPAVEELPKRKVRNSSTYGEIKTNSNIVETATATPIDEAKAETAVEAPVRRRRRITSDDAETMINNDNTPF